MVCIERKVRKQIDRTRSMPWSWIVLRTFESAYVVFSNVNFNHSLFHVLRHSYIFLFRVSIMSLKLHEYHSYRSLIPCRKSMLECTLDCDEKLNSRSRSNIGTLSKRFREIDLKNAEVEAKKKYHLANLAFMNWVETYPKQQQVQQQQLIYLQMRDVLFFWMPFVQRELHFST